MEYPNLIKKSLINPENEKLRDEIPKPPDVKEILEEILKKTSNIHVVFLFTEIGKRLLQQLAWCLCATRNSLLYSGWKELGIQLGLELILANCVENCKSINQDPVFTMLVPYTQMTAATVGKIYQGLYNIQRNDIITRTQSYVDEFYKEICKRCDMSKQTKILKPRRIPLPPVMFEYLEKINCNVNITNPVEEDNDNDYNDCAKIVMLTYSPEDSKIAQEVANEFRKERNGERIGVILLQEHAAQVFVDRETLIVERFARADFIIPILSTKYLTCILNKGRHTNIDNVDGYYAKFIYSLMTGDYIGVGCRNKKISCIIPDNHFSKICKHYIFKMPIFRTWVQLSAIDGLANKILSH